MSDEVFKILAQYGPTAAFAAILLGILLVLGKALAAALLEFTKALVKVEKALLVIKSEIKSELKAVLNLLDELRTEIKELAHQKGVK